MWRPLPIRIAYRLTEFTRHAQWVLSSTFCASKLCVNYNDLTLYDASAPLKIVFFLLFPACCYVAKICRSSCGAPFCGAQLFGRTCWTCLNPPLCVAYCYIQTAFYSTVPPRHLHGRSDIIMSVNCDIKIGSASSLRSSFAHIFRFPLQSVACYTVVCDHGSNFFMHRIFGSPLWFHRTM